MIEHWPWYISGLALAAVPIFHWLALGRNLAVSGRITAIVNRLRFGDTSTVPEMTQEELMAAVRAATIAALGVGAVEEPSPAADGPKPRLPSRLPFSNHLVFLTMMMVGGAVSANLAGAFDPQFALQGSEFNRFFDEPATVYAVLGVGGMLVGFGTRMSGGCTTGHGLCGVSRFQKGSLAATAAFFGAAVVVSVLLRGVLG